MNMPRILIGSSSEGLVYAEELQRLLRPEVESLLWNQGLFVPGEFALESLEQKAKRFHGSIVVATGDDRVLSRGTDSSAPRDNLLFEFGMFVAVFGRRRALLLVEDGGMKLPTDLGGLTYLPFSRTDPLAMSLGPVATRIKTVADGWQEAPVDLHTKDRFERLLRLSLSEIQERLGARPELGLHLFIVDERRVPSQLVRLARARTSPKSPRPWPPFDDGEGVVGTCWSTASSVLVDLTAEPFASATPATWALIDDLGRFGMSYEMLDQSRARYKSVGAVPINTIDSGFLGCVSFNIGVGSSASAADFRTLEVERALDRCSEMATILLDR